MKRKSEIVNTRGELMSMDLVEGGECKGKTVLVIHDNLATKARAPHLLDLETLQWLVAECNALLEQADG